MMKKLTDKCESMKGQYLVRKKTQVECTDQGQVVLIKKRRCHVQGNNSHGDNMLIQQCLLYDGLKSLISELSKE